MTNKEQAMRIAKQIKKRGPNPWIVGYWANVMRRVING